MDFKEIQELIKVFNRSNLTELKIEQENFKIVIKSEENGGAPVVHQMMQPMMQQPMMHQSPQMQNTAAPVAQNTSAPAAEAKGVIFKSPMIGTFYRTPGPDKDPFVKVGDKIEKGATVCIVEAMKLFNEIECDIAGTIVKILVDDSSPVEYDQPLFLIEP
jgi:acetyl-CoA carboxylase biotin carboxyl carrier protein